MAASATIPVAMRTQCPPMTFLLKTIIENAPADKSDGLEPFRSRFIFCIDAHAEGLPDPTIGKLSVSPANGYPDGARVTQEANDRAGIAVVDAPMRSSGQGPFTNLTYLPSVAAPDTYPDKFSPRTNAESSSIPCERTFGMLAR